MKKLLVVLAFGLFAVGWAQGPSLPEVRRTQRSRWKSVFDSRGIAYPPAGLLIRVFKEERQVELWAQGVPATAYRLLKTYAVTAASGEPGPKRKEGDRQVPEGVYAICSLNPRSRYRLSLRLNYPNASDRILSDAKRPGGDIFIHGKASSIGCVAIGDRAIEEVYTLVEDLWNRRGVWPQVHIFPCRMEGRAWRKLTAEYRADHDRHAFWGSLKPIYDAFEKSRLLPTVRVNKKGMYTVVGRQGGRGPS